MHGLHLLPAPAHTQEIGGLLAGEPSCAWSSSCRQCNPNHPPVESFLSMVVDSRAQIFQVAPSAPVAAARSNVVATALSSDFGELSASPEIIQSLQTAIELGPVRLLIPEILLI